MSHRGITTTKPCIVLRETSDVKTARIGGSHRYGTTPSPLPNTEGTRSYQRLKHKKGAAINGQTQPCNKYLRTRHRAGRARGHHFCVGTVRFWHSQKQRMVLEIQLAPEDANSTTPNPIHVMGLGTRGEGGGTRSATTSTRNSSVNHMMRSIHMCWRCRVADFPWIACTDYG